MTAMQPDVHTLTGAYVCDALDLPDRAAFEQHLRACAACDAEVAELREVVAILGIATAQEPPASLKEAVAARIRVSRQLPPIVTRITDAPSRRRLSRSAIVGWGVAAALAAVVGGLSVRTFTQQRQIAAVSAQASALSQLLSAPDARSSRVAVSGGGSATVIDSRSRSEVVVVLTGLAKLPAGKTYQLWLMGPDSSARSVGLVGEAAATTGGPATAAPVFGYGLGSADAIGMTIEPAGGTAQPTTTPVMVAPLTA